jgi:hypothetical protein
MKVTKQIPHACPVCKGRGEVEKAIAQHEAQPKYEGSEIYACHVCGGSCLIWEIREEEVEPPLLTGIQLPPTILTPNLPNIGLPQPYTVGDPPYPYSITWASNNPPGSDKLQANNSPAWKMLGINDGGCACSPPGHPHHDNCKAG